MQRREEFGEIPHHFAILTDLTFFNQDLLLARWHFCHLVVGDVT